VGEGEGDVRRRAGHPIACDEEEGGEGRRGVFQGQPVSTVKRDDTEGREELRHDIIIKGG
jgi:hypothetical protein